PNVGKSTLLNRFAKREAAIVSPYAGTTRDVIEVHLDLGGYPVTLRDTAGIRPTDDPVEQEGVRRAWQSATAANLVLWVLDGPAAESAGVVAVAEEERLAHTHVWFVINKADLMGPAERDRLAEWFQVPARVRFLVSAAMGEGVDNLVAAMGKFAETF